MQSWLEGRIWVGKGAQATGMTASLRIQSSKADLNTWESFTRSGLKLESVHQESPRSVMIHSQWWFGLPCHLLVLVHCVFWVHSQHSCLPGNFRALHASFCWQALWRCWFHFPAGLGTCPHCQRYQKLVQWPWCYCTWLASKLTRPEPHRESMGYCQEEDERHQTQQCRWAEGHCQRNLGFHTTSALPQTDHLHATPNLLYFTFSHLGDAFIQSDLQIRKSNQN